MSHYLVSDVQIRAEGESSVDAILAEKIKAKVYKL